MGAAFTAITVRISILVHTAPLLALVTRPAHVLALILVLALALLDRLFIFVAVLASEMMPVPACAYRIQAFFSLSGAVERGIDCASRQ